jgi:hypothetical protein
MENPPLPPPPVSIPPLPKLPPANPPAPPKLGCADGKPNGAALEPNPEKAGCDGAAELVPNAPVGCVVPKPPPKACTGCDGCPKDEPALLVLPKPN